MFKRLICFLLGLTILVAIVPFGATAQKAECSALPISQEFFKNSGPEHDFLNSYVNVQEFREYLLEQLAVCQAEIDVSMYHLPYTKASESAISRYIWKEMPENFHVNTLRFHYWTDTFEVSKIEVTYYNTPQEYQAMLAACEKSADRMLEGVLGNESLSEAEKALLLHDRLALSCVYDDSASENRYDMYGALVNGVAVCEGYTKAYSYLLDRVGIENYFCDSDLLVHAWNIIYIDDVPYHVDVTWDDLDMIGLVAHDNFLRSSNGIVSTGHSANGLVDFDTTPTATKYDSFYWQKSISAFQLIGDALYFIDHDSEKLCRVGESQNVLLYSVSDAWQAGAGSYWNGNFSALSTACNSLLFSQSDGIYAYHLKDGSVTPVYLPDLSSRDYLSVYGFVFENGELLCEISNMPLSSSGNASYQEKVPYQAEARDHVYDDSEDVLCNLCGGLRAGVEYLLGDVDGDLSVTSADAVYLLYHTLFPTRYPVEQPVNFDGEGNVTSADAVYLLYHTLFPTRYPLI